MSYALSRPFYRPTSSPRSVLLLVVIGVHAGLFLLAMAAKALAPQIMEMPMVVDLLPAPPAPAPPPAKPVLPVKAATPQPQPLPRTPPPVLESTISREPAPAAPLAAPPEVVPAPPAPPPPAVAPTLSPARFDADYLRNPAPAYPPLSRRMGEEGKVVLRVSVSPQGAAESVEIRTSSGSARLDEAAGKTVSNWRFIAAKRGDVAVQSWVLVPIIFKLEQ